MSKMWKTFRFHNGAYKRFARISATSSKSEACWHLYGMLSEKMRFRD